MSTLGIQRQPYLIRKIKYITFLEMPEVNITSFSIKSFRLINFMPTKGGVRMDLKKKIKEKKDKPYIAPILLNRPVIILFHLERVSSVDFSKLQIYIQIESVDNILYYCFFDII